MHPVWELRPNPQNLRLAIAVNPLMSKPALLGVVPRGESRATDLITISLVRESCGAIIAKE